VIILFGFGKIVGSLTSTPLNPWRWITFLVMSRIILFQLMDPGMIGDGMCLIFSYHLTYTLWLLRLVIDALHFKPFMHIISLRKCCIFLYLGLIYLAFELIFISFLNQLRFWYYHVSRLYLEFQDIKSRRKMHGDTKNWS